MDAATASLPLADGVTLTLTPRGAGRWSCGIEPAGARRRGRARSSAKLRDGRALAHPGFRLHRDAIPPAAAGERPIEADQSNDSVVVGERIVVKWLRQVDDAAHPAPATLAHLADVGYHGIPKSYGALLWRAPSGREVPCGTVSAYLPGARDGYQWCVELATEAIARGEREGGTGAGAAPDDDWVSSFPARLGRLTAGLHAALATPSGVVPAPVAWPTRARCGAGTTTARRLLEAGRRDVRPGTGRRARRARGGGPPPVAPSAALAAARDRLARRARPAARTPARRRSSACTATSTSARCCAGAAGSRSSTSTATRSRRRFAPDGVDLAVQPGRARRRAPARQPRPGRAGSSTGCTASPSPPPSTRGARRRGSSSSRAYVGGAARLLGRTDLFDERLLAPFVAEQVCRDVLYAVEHLPRWAYAVTGGAACTRW